MRPARSAWFGLRFRPTPRPGRNFGIKCFWPKAREATAQAAREAPQSQIPPDQIPPGWNPDTTKFYPELTLRNGESVKNLHLQPKGNSYFQAKSGPDSLSLGILQLPGPVAAEMGGTPHIIQAFGMVANTYTRLRRWEGVGEENRKGEMKKIWAAETSQKRQVAIVETKGGFFYGHLDTADPLDETELNWVQATQSQKDKFSLRKIKTENAGDKKKLLSLLDNSAAKSLAFPLVTPDRARISPSHLKRFLDGGMPALLVELAEPPGDGIEIPPPVESTGAGAGLEIQKVTDSISIFPETWDASVFRFRVATEQRVREVESKRVGGRTQTIEKPWKKRQTSEFVEVPADLDGGLRLTDGKAILELIPDRLGKLEVHTWEVVPNGLAR
jgi:hypothetical protein